METKARDELVSAKALDVMRTYEEKLNALREAGTELTDEQTKALERTKQKQEELNKLVEDYNRTRNEKASKGIKSELDKEMKTLDNQIANASRNTAGKNEAYTRKISELRTQYESLQRNIDAIDWNGQSEEQVEALRSRLKDVMDEIDRIKEGLAIATGSGDFKEANQNQIARLNTQMESWMSKYTGASQYFPQIQEL